MEALKRALEYARAASSRVGNGWRVVKNWVSDWPGAAIVLAVIAVLLVWIF